MDHPRTIRNQRQETYLQPSKCVFAKKVDGAIFRCNDVLILKPQKQ